MANRLFSPSAQKFGVLGRKLQTALTAESVKNYSNQSWRKKNTYVEQVLFGHLDKQPTTVWPDPNLGCLGPKDNRFALPGNVGLNGSLLPKSEEASSEQIESDRKLLHAELKFWHTLCEAPTSYKRQIDILRQHEEVDKIEMDQLAEIEKKFNQEDGNFRFESEALECIANDCPSLLRREVAEMFSLPEMADKKNGPLTAITVCQKSKFDMSSWSDLIEDERDKLMENFVDAGKAICMSLQGKGMWADFIDPGSGRPFFGNYTNLTFFETDERYRHLGFEILDLGCCKVISHHKWGTHSFVGTIFTSANHDCRFLEEILQSTNDALVNKPSE